MGVKKQSCGRGVLPARWVFRTGRCSIPRPLLILFIVAVLTACDRPQSVVDGPFNIGPSPSEVSFTSPALVTGPRRELCFLFDPPGGSHSAHGIHTVLITVLGRRDSVKTLAVDRRGESRVCLVAEPLPDSLSSDTGAIYRSVELSSPVPLRIARLEWRTGR